MARLVLRRQHMASPNFQDLAPSSGDGRLRLPSDVVDASGLEALFKIHELDLDCLANPNDWTSLDGGPYASGHLLLAVFAIQLSRYTGQDVVPVRISHPGVPPAAPAEGRVEFRLPSGTTARDILIQAREQLTRPEPYPPCIPVGEKGAAFRWADAGPDADLVAEFDRHDPAGLADGEALELLVVEAGGRRRGFFIYDARRFRPETIQSFAGHLTVLSDGFEAGLDRPVSALPLLTMAERGWLADTTEGRAHVFPDVRMHELVERHAAETPGALAVRFGPDRLTYAELNRRANQLAHQLMRLGMGTDCRVIVCVEPSLDIVVTLLAILKVGAVYVPVDPTHPPARIAALLAETCPALIVAQEHIAERLDLGSFPLLRLPVAVPQTEQSDAGNPGVAVNANWPAYIYFTSGTTGRPKGVVASQANLSAYLQVAAKRYEVGPGDVMPAIARFTFSISMFELMLPLVSGATLVVLERQQVLDLPRLAQALSGVTFFHAGPSLLRSLLAHIRQSYADYAIFSRVRHASSGGDMIPPEVLEGLKEVFAHAEIFVIYGCSEISCMGCTWAVPRFMRVERTFVGRPFDNMSVRVIGEGFEQVPVGVAGEIVFAGAGVVKGYLNRDELTADRFIMLAGRRYYRTGDVGRIHAGGELEILGRNDFQIKLRGMRIEPAEIEHHLRRAPGVREAVVSARPASNGEMRLIAYVVLDEIAAKHPAAATTAIRRYTTEHLPDYMVPSTFVRLERLPLNHNMKLDRRALPEPPETEDRIESDPDAREPTTQTERAVAAIWCAVLKRERAALDENFFEVGGDSLRAVELIVRIQRELGCTVDGMDVLRESLEVVSTICDQQLGRPVSRAPEPRTPRQPTEAVTTLHFGPGQGLYGVLRTPRGGDTGRAALICSPMGHERVRTHFVLGRLARELVARGVTVLGFDYFGSGDSLGDSAEATCTRWQQDIVHASLELRRRVQPKAVIGIGARLGATLMCGARRHLQPDFARLVFWDPVTDGAAHCDELRDLHGKYLRAAQFLRLGRRPRRVHGFEELMGATYSTAALQELRHLVLDPSCGAPGSTVPVRWLVTSSDQAQSRRNDAAGSLRRVEAGVDCRWRDPTASEELLPDVGIARILADLAMEDP